MLVEIVKTFTDPGGNVHLAGSQEHVRTSTAEQYFDWQVAKRPVYKTFKEAMDAKEKERVSALPKSAAPATGWSIRESTGNDLRVRFVVVETSPLGGTTFYDAPPSHAPASVKQKFADAIATDANAFSERAAFLEKQRNEPSRTNGYNEFDLARVTFGANGVRKS